MMAKIMYSQIIEVPSIEIEQEGIETVEQYVYLGQLVPMNGTQEKELKRRKPWHCQNSANSDRKLNGG